MVRKRSEGGRIRPLGGMTVILTRPRNQARDMAGALRAAGARVLLAPLIRIEPPVSYDPLDRALRRLGGYDTLVFASANASERFFARAKALRLKALPRPRRLFAVGPGTARSLSGHGWPGAVQPAEHRAEALARRLGRVRGWKILIPRAAEGREALPRLLRNAGAAVTTAPCYRTVTDPAGARLIARAGGAQGVIVVFASPSAVKAARKALGASGFRALFLKARAAALGPVTASALRACGVRPGIVSPKPTAGGLAAALREGRS